MLRVTACPIGLGDVIWQQQSDSTDHGGLQASQMMAQVPVLGFELGQAYRILARFRQQLLGGGIGAAVREFGWLGCLAPRKRTLRR